MALKNISPAAYFIVPSCINTCFIIVVSALIFCSTYLQQHVIEYLAVKD